MTTVQVCDFNSTLFELTDEMMALIKPSAVMTTGYAVFKNMYTSNPENDMALKAFWEVAKENKELIEKNDLAAIADVLRGILPVPGMVDDVWNSLSEENRSIVADYIRVLYDQACAIGVDEEQKEESGSTATMYSMYNDIWRDFLLLLETSCRDNDPLRDLLADSRAKLDTVISTKGDSTEMVFAVIFPCMQPILPQDSIQNEADIVRLCLPPSDTTTKLKQDRKALRDVGFPFNRKLPFSDLLGLIVRSVEHEEKLALFWHYIKLFTVCVNECPPEILGMMNQFVAFFHHDQRPDAPKRFLRNVPALLTK